MDKIDEAIKDLKLHLNNNRKIKNEIILLINEQERQLTTLEIIKNK